MMTQEEFEALSTEEKLEEALRRLALIRSLIPKMREDFWIAVEKARAVGAKGETWA